MLFNDVLYRIKTSGELSHPLRVFTTDKEYVKLFIAATAGRRFVVPTVAVYRNPADLETAVFPSQCCIKPTHLSGYVILRVADEPVSRRELQGWFHLNHYRSSGELNYKSLTPGVIIEPLLFGSLSVLDFKVFCYKGSPRLIQVDLDRFSRHRRLFYDTNWTEQPYSLAYPKATRHLDRPLQLDLMLDACAAIARYFDFVRIDTYTDGVEVYIGEITHCHGSAGETFQPATAEDDASHVLFGEDDRKKSGAAGTGRCSA